MKIRLLRIPIIVGAILFLSKGAFAQCTTLVLQPDSAAGKDADINSCVACGYTNMNFGSGTELNASAWTYQGNPGGDRSLLQFDLSGVPANATIQSATLTLYNNPNSSNGLGNGQHSHLSGSNTAWLQRITSTWAENTVTWNTQPTTTTLNEVALPQDTNPNENYVLDVKALVIDMINNPTTSFGFMLKLQTEQYYRCLLFASSDHPNAALHPKLEICYTVPSSCISLVLQPDSIAGKDAGITSCVANGYDTTNMGYSSEFNIEAWTYQGNPGITRSLVQFDLSGVPANAIIQSAYLTLYNNPNSVNGLGNGQHSQLSGSDAAWVQRITSPWLENTVTWVNQPTSTTLNEVALPADTNPHQNYVADVKQLVLDMINNPTTSFGFMLELQTEQYYRCLLFASSDHPNAALHPKLEICYTVPSSCISLVLQPGGVAGKDAPIYSCVANGYDTTNFGSDLELNALAWTYQGNPGVGRGLLQFNLSGVPINATIQSATLTLYNNPQSQNGLLNGQHSQLSGSDAAWLQRVTSTWAENTVTWNTQPTTTTLNEVALPADTNPNENYVVDVKQLVIDMINNPTTSFGFMLKLQTEQYYRCLLFASSDHPDSTLHPKLEICYTVPSACTSLVLQPDSAAGKDADINSCIACGYVNANMGYGHELNASAWTYQGNPGGDRSLLQFDLSGVPANATIQTAYLTLYNNPNSSNGLQNGQHSHLSGSNAAWLQRVTSTWAQNTVTWNNQPTTTTINEVALPQDTNPNENYILDVKALVIDMINNPTTSFGFMVKLQTEQYYRCLLFASCEHPNYALHPKLEICYITQATGLPTAVFTSSDTAFCNETGKCIHFYDHSTGNPTSWQWFFPGATPSTSTAQNPDSICYYTPGTYDVTLIASNSNGSDTLHVTSFILYATTPNPPTITYSGDTLFSSTGTSYQWFYNGSPIGGATYSYYVYNTPGTYSVQVTSNEGCPSISNGFVITSANDLSGQSGIKIYPNPASQSVVISMPFAINGTTELKILDITGREIYTKQLPANSGNLHTTIDVSSFAKGVYILELRNEKNQYRGRFIKE